MKALRAIAVIMLLFVSACYSRTHFDGPMEVVLTDGAVVSCSNSVWTGDRRVYCLDKEAGRKATFEQNVVAEIRRVKPENK